MTQKIENLTSDVWMFNDIPEAKDRIDVPMTLILSRTLWQRFLSTIDNDADLAVELFSSLIGQKLDDWIGRSWEPGMFEDIVQAALNKHIPMERKA